MDRGKFCHFCGLPSEVLKALFVRDGIGICDRCIECCNLALAEPGKKGDLEYESWSHISGSDGK